MASPTPLSENRKPAAFILGYGDNIGAGVAQKFKDEGFNVAVASRSLDPEGVRSLGYFGINLDLARTEDIGRAFESAEQEHGPASVVVYNGALTLLREP